MNTDTDTLIEELSEKAGPVTPVWPLPIIIATGMLLAAVYVTLFAALVGLRSDIAARIAYAPFFYEVAFSAVTVAAAIIAAGFHAFPDLSQRRFITRWLPILPLGGFLAVFGLEVAIRPPADALYLTAYGMQCAAELCLFSLLPAALLYMLLARGVFLRAKEASLCLSLAASMTGYLALRLVEPTDDMLHLLFWHLLPLFLMMALLTLGHLRLSQRQRL